MKAIMYGAGNIGRGFVGALLSQAGYDVAFVDVAEPVVRALNERRSYPVRIVDTDGHEDILIQNVGAVDGRDADAVAEAIAGADIMATAVGVNVLKFIAPNIAEGLRRRFHRSDAPLDILICENLMDASRVLAGLIKAHLTDEESAVFDARVGLVEASIGRMVPVQTPAMQDGDMLRVCVERYGLLPVDADAFKGPLPKIGALVPYSPFGYYLMRKLYIHNMGHALCAYLGAYETLTYIWEAVANADIALIARCAMEESLRGLCAEYGTDPLPLLDHIDDLLFRFTNRALGDTCARVGGDVPRKLSPGDRLIGAARLCAKHGVAPAHIAIGAAAAVHQYLAEQGMDQTEANAARTLADLAQLHEGSGLMRLILAPYTLLARGASLSALRELALRRMGV